MRTITLQIPDPPAGVQPEDLEGVSIGEAREKGFAIDMPGLPASARFGRDASGWFLVWVCSDVVIARGGKKRRVNVDPGQDPNPAV